ncbi:MAG: Fe-S cluster assembly protein SufD [Magnetococcales bacterium]|nr:Fe-S cluster assembly protein SufD [Magnetococcales bacterium]MBF0149743.1 Fe-S cluster assembly protein SufD [Magnetococcales bacterium]
MNTAMNSHQAHFIAHAATLPGHDSALIHASRQAAMQRFMGMGFPTKKLERWKHTSTQVIAQTVYRHVNPGCVGLDPADLDPYLIARQGIHRLVFINGLFVNSLSDMSALPGGVQAGSLARVVNESPGVVAGCIETFPTGDDQGFSELNHALWPDGAFVHVSTGTRLTQPLHLLFITTASREPMITQPWNVLIFGSDTHALVVEHYVTLGHTTHHLTNPYTSLILDDRAHVHHLLLLGERLPANHVGTVQVTQKAGSHLGSHLFANGGERTRQEVHVTLAGAEAECALDGLFFASGRQHMDFQTSMHHACGHTRSRQLYKGILDEQSRGVFNGVIRVPPGVHHTQSRQTTANLLLSDTAEIDARPQLEIHSDAVQCSHGATVGSLDPDALFYLQSRGLDVNAARALLIHGFAEELLQRVAPAEVRGWVGRSLNPGEGVRDEDRPGIV